jgi:hypothetical protein
VLVQFSQSLSRDRRFVFDQCHYASQRPPISVE